MHFEELFIKTHQEYDYDQLCEEIESLQRDDDESIDDFNLRILKNYYRFNYYDRPLKEYFDKTRISIILKFLTELEIQCSINELKNCKLEPHEFFGAFDSFSSEKHFVLSDIDVPCNNENIDNAPSNFKSPLLAFKANDTT